MSDSPNNSADTRSVEGKPVQIGLLGYGWWGKVIAQQIAASTALALRAVVEPDTQVRAQATAELARPGLTVTSDLDAVLVDPLVEAVILCTPHLFHADQIVAAARAGKHVFCEKPLCLTLADARRAVDECRRRGLVMGIGHERRFEPAIVKLRQDIAAGRLGTLLQIEANFSQDKFFALPKDNWRLSNKHAPVGPLTATGIHLVDLAIALLGPAESVWARLATRGSQFENGDTLGLLLAFEGGANALISAMLATPFEGRLAVYGSKGWVEIRDRTHPEHPTGWDVTTVLRGQERHSEFFAPFPSVRANLEAFALAIRGGAAYPVSHVEMLANVAALEAIMASAQGAGLVDVAGPD
jgi:predicted dehydrogenase